MPFHIRHGAPGSYKSACAVHLDMLEWLKQGRVVHTNVRGIGDVADFELAYGITLPESAGVVAYNLRNHDDRMRFAAWFHWLPLGDAIVIDEGQFIYPDRRDFKPTDLDLADEDNPINPETGERERPSDIFQAVDMHRHYNWDGVVTTPSIKKLPQWFRGAVERAYKHENRSHIPLQKGKTRIISHSPDTLNPTIAKGVPVQTIKVPKHVFKVYGSTTTGEVTQNISKRNPLKTPAVYIPLGIAALALAWTLNGLFDMSGSEEVDDVADAPRPGSPAVSRPGRHGDKVDTVAVSVASDVVDASRSAYDVLSSALPGVRGVVIAGWYGLQSDGLKYLYRVSLDGQDVVVKEDWLANAGFDVTVESNCAHDLYHPLVDTQLRVLCAPASRETSEAERASGAAGAQDAVASISPVS